MRLAAETSLKADEAGRWQILTLIPWAKFLFSDDSVGCSFGLNMLSATGEFLWDLRIGIGLLTFAFEPLLIFNCYDALI